MTPEQVAECAHEMNRLWCVSLHDYSQERWIRAPEWQKESALQGVMEVIRNPSQTPERSHESWSRTKLEEGWVYGPVKDPEKRTHPCLVPYDQLPPEQQVKDLIFTQTVRTLLAATDLIEGVKA